MSDHRFDTCSLCPRLCRHACPVASGSAREASVPTQIASVMRDYSLDRAPRALALAAATLCTDCGACQEACHLHVPLPAHLRAARQSLVAESALAPLEPVEGDALLTAVEADDRPLAALLAGRLGQPVSRWPTADQLGWRGIEGGGSAWEAHAGSIRGAAGSRRLAIVDGGVAVALRTAGVSFVWAWELLGGDASGSSPSGTVGSCAAGGERPAACCGGAGPLPQHHPEDAARLARRFWESASHSCLLDARCRGHIRRAGADASDWLDRTLVGDR